MAPAVLIRNLKKVLTGQSRRVRDVSLTIQHGEIFGLLGPIRGQAKPTTFAALCTLRYPDVVGLKLMGIPVLEKVPNWTGNNWATICPEVALDKGSDRSGVDAARQGGDLPHA